MGTQGESATGRPRFVWKRECRWIIWGSITLAGMYLFIRGIDIGGDRLPSGEPVPPSTSQSFAVVGSFLFTPIALVMTGVGLHWRAKGWPRSRALAQQQYVDALRQWEAARSLYRMLGSGSELPARPAGPVVLRPGEQVHVQVEVGYSRYVAAGDGSYVHLFSSGPGAYGLAMTTASMIGNYRRKAAAELAASPMWRENQQVHVMAGNYGLIAFVRGQIMHFDWDAVAAFYPEPQHGRVVFEFRGSQPLMLHGPASPLIAVYAARHLLPEQQFRVGHEMMALR